MLDPAVSAAIKKYGLMKWATMEYPYLVFSTALALAGVGMGFYCALRDLRENTKSKYFARYVVMRPDDPRLENIITFGDDGKPINP